MNIKNKPITNTTTRSEQTQRPSAQMGHNNISSNDANTEAVTCCTAGHLGGTSMVKEQSQGNGRGDNKKAALRATETTHGGRQRK